MSTYLLTIKRVYRRTDGAVLVGPLTSSWTDGASVTLENVVDFDPAGGSGVFEPGTARAEVFEYGGTNEDTEQLTGVIRTGPRFAHARGTFVQEGATATVEMLVDGYLEDEETPVVGIRVPTELELTLSLGVRDQEDMETIPVTLDDEEDFSVSGAPIGAPLVYRTDDDGVKVDTARNSVTIGPGGLFELDDVAGTAPAGTTGKATIYYDSAGAGGSGVYVRKGTAAPVKMA